MIHPLLSFSIKGVLWYQGENNVGNAEPYTDWLTCMIGDWRNRWNSELPFYIIQLPNFDSINNLFGRKCEMLKVKFWQFPEPISS